MAKSKVGRPKKYDYKYLLQVKQEMKETGKSLTEICEERKVPRISLHTALKGLGWTRKYAPRTAKSTEAAAPVAEVVAEGKVA